MILSSVTTIIIVTIITIIIISAEELFRQTIPIVSFRKE
jgi:hypothetical protein